MGLLFALAFITKRRFGVLGLALGAGMMLSTMWVGNLTPIVAQTGIEIVRPPLQSVVTAVLILLPALLLLMSGPTYKSSLQRIGGSALFGILAVTFLLPVFGSALVIDGIGMTMYSFFTQYRDAIVTIGLVAATIDLLVTKTPKHRKEHDKH